VPSAHSGPYGITAGPDGALWFTEYFGNNIGQAVFVTASLSVSPASGSYRRSLTFTGSGFAPNESVQIYIKGIGSAVLASATADASGRFNATARAPQGTWGPRIFLSLGQRSGKLGAANFSMTPRLILEPNAGAVGATVAAHGFGFASLETVDVYWENPATLLGTAQTDLHGTFGGRAGLSFTVRLLVKMCPWGWGEQQSQRRRPLHRAVIEQHSSDSHKVEDQLDYVSSTRARASWSLSERMGSDEETTMRGKDAAGDFLPGHGNVEHP
jgi:hypothetical protein